MPMPEFENVLPRLAATFEAGRLVPFIGSGMSAPVCTSWPAFIESLERSAGIAGGPLTATSPREVLVRRANLAVRTLKRARPGSFAAAVRAGLLARPGEAPAALPQTDALARLDWPLVLTTNYDNCYAAAFHRLAAGRELAVLGRGVEDCQRVLTSLSNAGRSLLWALQGYLADLPHAGVHGPELAALEHQLVVGHEEYRQVTYREAHFRRAFAEVFRQRSLLFLGAGLQESYLQELFGEVLEHFGPGTRTHYAFIPAGEVDPEFMLARFQIVVVEYPRGEHDHVRARLDALADAVARPSRAATSWSWGRVESTDAGHWASVPDLEVVRGPLPTAAASGECLAVSAGGSGSAFFFSPGIRQVLQQWGVVDSMPDRLSLPYLGRFGELPVFAVRARNEADERSLAQVHDASRALFEQVGPRFRCIRMQLLATGGQDKVDLSTWQVRNYPERFSFIQTLRAWAGWRRAHPHTDCRLVLHVVADSVIREIASGRIDVLELLSCVDMRFFGEVLGEQGELERRLFQLSPDTRLAAVAGDLQLAPGLWEARVTPPPGLDDLWHALDEASLAQTVQAFGVVPGSTLHFRRPLPGG
jgi:hypothetical protein